MTAQWLQVVCICSTAIAVCCSSAQAESPLLQALARKGGCEDPTNYTRAANCLFKSWYGPKKKEWPRGRLTYGELEAEGIDQLLEYIAETGVPLGREDVFADLGSGHGKPNMYVFLRTPVLLSLGVELLAERHEIATEARKNALNAIKALHSPEASQDDRELRYVLGDIHDTAVWSGASVVFMNSLCFPPPLMYELRELFLADLRPGSLIFSSRSHGGCFPERFQFVGSFSVKVSWSDIGTNTNIYLVRPKLTMPTDVNIYMNGGQLVLDSCADQMLHNKVFANEHLTRRSCYFFTEEKFVKPFEKAMMDGRCVWNETQYLLSWPQAWPEPKKPRSFLVSKIAEFISKGPAELPQWAEFISKRPPRSMILHQAVMKPLKASTLSMLLEARADPLQRDKHGRSVLHTALKQEQDFEIVETLLRVRADAGTADKYKEEPLHLALKKNQGDVLKKAEALVKARASVATQNYFGETALHLASDWQGKTAVDLTSLLLEARANPSIKDAVGETALQRAQSPEVKALLELLTPNDTSSEAKQPAARKRRDDGENMSNEIQNLLQEMGSKKEL